MGKGRSRSGSSICAVRRRDHRGWFEVGGHGCVRARQRFAARMTLVDSRTCYGWPDTIGHTVATKPWGRSSDPYEPTMLYRGVVFVLLIPCIAHLFGWLLHSGIPVHFAVHVV